MGLFRNRDVGPGGLRLEAVDQDLPCNPVLKSKVFQPGQCKGLTGRNGQLTVHVVPGFVGYGELSPCVLIHLTPGQ